MRACMLVVFVSGKRKIYSKEFTDLQEALASLHKFYERAILAGLLTTHVVGMWVQE